MRADILSLQQSHPQLAEEFVRLRDKLEAPVTSGVHDISWQPRAHRRYDTGRELDELISKIHNTTQAKIFQGPPGETEILAAAKNGPIVVINIAEHRCDALLVERHQIRAVSLNGLSREDIEERVKQGNLGSPQILRWLWDTVASPVLDALGYTKPPKDQDWPHVWWIPTGPLTKFPLYAAGRHGKYSSEAVLDRVMSSYSSSVRAIIRGRQQHMQSSVPDKALLIAMERTPGHNPLPFATNEVAVLEGLCRSIPLQPIKPERRKQDIMLHLQDCKVFHFAGHGFTDAKDPSESHLCLDDWQDAPLRVADLLELNLRAFSPFLAYLSACGTGRIQVERFIDENIHLINACQLAGFRHVIGTLWEVNDELCVDMARIVYEGMRDWSMTDDSVCRGLHTATRALRDRWLGIRPEARANRLVSADDKPFGEGSVASDTSVVDEGGVRLSRDATLYGGDTARPVHWAPYVHFGV